MTNQPDWEKYFNEKFGFKTKLETRDGSKAYLIGDITELRDFIRSTIQAEKEALLEELEKEFIKQSPFVLKESVKGGYTMALMVFDKVKQKLLSELGDKK